ncbi:MAG: hypothetical protein WC781_05750 [Candidatus Pacearchaeota archaeon]|jgi:hypothetical protein
MEIIYCEKTKETGERLVNLMPEELTERNIILNVGNSNYRQKDNSPIGNEELILNSVNSIKNCVNKKEMFRIFKENRIKSVSFIDLDKPMGKIKSSVILLFGKELVLRKDKEIEVIKLSEIKRLFKNKFDYATIKENRILEYRIIVFKNKVVRAMVKLNYGGDFVLKQDNSKFIDVNINKIPHKTINNLLKATKYLGIDLCGIDLLVNKNGKFKILEVNSGMALCSKSINQFYDILRYYLFMEKIN